MIEVKNIKKSYQDREVLKGVDFEVQKGEIVAIVGDSGAGKSTLLHIIGTLEIPDEGSIQIDNQNLRVLKGTQMAQFRNQHIGFVFQFHNLLPEFNALENICMPAWMAKQSKKETQNKAEDLMKRLGILELKKQLPSEMSGGEQQRTAIARALINSPKVVLADEPSGNLDPRNSQELHQLFLELREEFQQTFVIVTHNHELANLSDRKVQIADGFLKTLN